MKQSVCLPALVLASCFAVAAPATAVPSDTSMVAVPAAPQLDAALRSLWQGHIAHTRDYAMAVHARDTAQARLAADAVVANARQIADAVGSFYGKLAGQQMLKLLAVHWSGVKALTDARAVDDPAGQQRAMIALDGNAQAIAVFLSSANPNLPERAVQGLLTAHVAHHATQIEQIMRGDTRNEAATWLAMRTHMDTIADALATAIAKQFPGKVS